MNTPRRLSFLAAKENHETFFKRIECFFPSLDQRYQAIKRAYDDAKDAFRGQTRDGGERYFEHLRAVALILIDYLHVRDYELIVAGLLHDIVEDIQSWSIARVEREYGGKVALLVEWLTKPVCSQSESKEDRDMIYHQRFRFASREFFLIKLADRWHNLLTLSECSKEKQRRKIEETKIYYLPYAERELILFHELESAIAAIEKTRSKPKKAQTKERRRHGKNSRGNGNFS